MYVGLLHAIDFDATHACRQPYTINLRNRTQSSFIFFWSTVVLTQRKFVVVEKMDVLFEFFFRIVPKEFSKSTRQELCGGTQATLNRSHPATFMTPS